MKSQIIKELGQTAILLPALIAQGLAANDRVKVRLSVLQAAARHARDPLGGAFDLSEECRLADIDAMAMETLVNGAAAVGGERIVAAGLGKLEAAIWDDVDAMIRAVTAGDAAEGDSAGHRLAVLRAAAAAQPPDTLELTHIGRLADISGGNGGSLHRLVMDLHKTLNRLAASHAEEVLAGAHVYGLAPQDRPAIEAFMRGVEAESATAIIPQ